MKIEVPYGDGTLSADLPESVDVTVIRPKEVPPRDEKRLVMDAVSEPLGSKPLPDFLRGHGEFLVVVNDATRQTPTAKVLGILSSVFEESDPRFLIATGSHRPPTADEVQSILGSMLQSSPGRVEYHDATNSELADLGVTSRGTPVRVNRRLLEFDRILLINSVEPHYFAGFTGGRKSILPGLSSYQTIEANHRHALEPGATTMSLAGNPVHEDMVEAVQLLDAEKLFSVNLVLDGEGRICHVGAGDITESFEEAANRSRKVNAVAVGRLADIAITAASHPSDVDLYQSQKALDNAKLAVRKGGTVILVSKCTEGIGKRDFFDLMAKESDPSTVLKKLKSGYRLGWHKAAKMAEMTMNFDVLAVTSLHAEDIAGIFMDPHEDLQSAVDRALSRLGDDVSLTVMPLGGSTVPRVQGFGGYR